VSKPVAMTASANSRQAMTFLPTLST
jgi:hypothetical protein